MQDLLDRSGGRAELLVHFSIARGYEVVDWNHAGSDLFALDADAAEQSPLRWEQLPAFLAHYLSQALQLVTGAPEEPMPDLAHPLRSDQHFIAKVFYQGVAAEDGQADEDEHWYLFCFQDAVNWIEHSEGTVNRKKLETIGELASGIAHDFNNLIMGIQSNAESMLAYPNMTPQAREGLVNIIRGCATGASLTRSLLGYAKRQPPTLTPFNLIDLTHDVTRIAGIASGNCPVSLGKDLTERGAPIMVVGSYSSLSHCVLNLIKNAREAMPEGGAIHILWEGDENTAVLTVRDHGSGIPETDMAHIFEPFFTTKQQGTGLGLAMVRDILSQHGGTVEIRSTVGIGTSVSLVWPRGIKASSAATEAVDLRRSTQRIVRSSTKIFTESKQQSAENHFLLYVIDDDDLVREGLCSLLEHLGHRTESFRQPEVALEKLLAAPQVPEVIIVDFNMPGMSGTQFIEKYCAACGPDRPSPETQILLMSGMPPDHFDSFLAGFSGLKIGILEKPFSLETLRGRIAEIQRYRETCRAEALKPPKEEHEENGAPPELVGAETGSA